ncbi:MAG: ribbon-helix-helix protein, CopG family [Deltaproteobacteria bacterium]|nr:ribbon-helix-helix protein, CopG family [Deltaproteobacteria bacterium]
MNTETVRLNITLPKDLVAALNRLAGRRQRNRFITDSVKERLAYLEKIELENRLAEGYQAAVREGAAITKDFEAVDLEGWDEY